MGQRRDLRKEKRRDKAGVLGSDGFLMRGENCPAHKLTAKDVAEIKYRLETETWRGVQRELAREYGVSHSTIHRIKLGSAWAWLRSDGAVDDAHTKLIQHVTVISDETVSRLRAEYERGDKSMAQLAKYYGMSAMTVADIVSNVSHRWVKLCKGRGPDPVTGKKVGWVDRAYTQESDVPVIRRLHAEGKSAKAIAETYGVNRRAIYSIVNGKTFKGVGCGSE